MALGGSRKKSKSQDAQRNLLDAIWKLKGGVRSVANILDEHIQSPINWRNRGGVPLIMCLQVSEKLKIPIWGLNYTELQQFYGSTKAPTWELVVKSYGLEMSEVSRILTMAPPS